MQKVLLLSAAYGWFAGLLTIMIVVTVLFALIVFIALKPIKKDDISNEPVAKKLLGRRETELTIALLNKDNDAKTNEELMGKLREVKSAEELVDELIEEDKAVEGEEPAKAKPKKTVKSAPITKPKSGVKSSKPVKAQATVKTDSKPENTENNTK